MGKHTDKKVVSRLKRKVRVRKKIRGSDEKPRLCVFRSARYTYAQLISDDSGATLLSASTKEFPANEKSARSVESAKLLGRKMAELAKEKNISEAVFDRNGYLYHGRIQAVAEGAREEGLKV